MNRMLRYRKAQAAGAITWLVATVIVIVLLFIFIYAATLLSESRAIEQGVRSVFSSSFDDSTSRWISEKNNLSFSREGEDAAIRRWLYETNQAG